MFNPSVNNSFVINLFDLHEQVFYYKDIHTYMHQPQEKCWNQIFRREKLTLTIRSWPFNIVNTISKLVGGRIYWQPILT
jgi:hypothetical protein